MRKPSLVLTLMLAALAAACLAWSVQAAPYDSYTYNFWDERQQAPQAYLPTRGLDGVELGVGAFQRPADLAVRNDLIYILDSGNDRIVCFDDEWNLQLVIQSFTVDGEEDTFDRPSGLHVTDEGHIYVADTGNSRVVELAPDGTLVRIIGEPETDVPGILPTDFRYTPRKIAVDQLGRIYVISGNVYEGILLFLADGEFRGFIGAPRVAPTVADVFWHRFATDEQRARMVLFLPIEYANFSLNDQGMLYAVQIGPAEEESLKLLNPSGIDVLRRTAEHPIVGDPALLPEEASRFVDVLARPHGGYSLLDRMRGRVFTYAEGGHLLYVFGGLGDVLGRFRAPTAIASLNDTLLVIDHRQITVFEPTEYARLIHAAIDEYNRGHYDASAEKWLQVIERNANLELAYSNVGRSLLRTEQYAEAMEFFRLGQDRPGYSEAFARYRRDVVADHIGWIMSGVAFLFVGGALMLNLNVMPKLSRRFGFHSTEVPAAGQGPSARLAFEARRILAGLWYSLHVIFHPFDGFWDLKHEKRGTVITASILFLAMIASFIFQRQYTAFTFNERDVTQLHVFSEALSVVLPFALWTGVNWAFTTLMEGKGTLRDIYIASAYSLTPMVLFFIPTALLSHILTLPEGTFITLFLVISLIWSMSLLLLSMVVVHEYTMLKAIGATLLIVAGIASCIFIALLLASVVDHVLRFVIGVYFEYRYR